MFPVVCASLKQGFFFGGGALSGEGYSDSVLSVLLPPLLTRKAGEMCVCVNEVEMKR